MKIIEQTNRIGLNNVRVTVWIFNKTDNVGANHIVLDLNKLWLSE